MVAPANLSSPVICRAAHRLPSLDAALNRGRKRGGEYQESVVLHGIGALFHPPEHEDRMECMLGWADTPAATWLIDMTLWSDWVVALAVITVRRAEHHLAAVVPYLL